MKKIYIIVILLVPICAMAQEDITFKFNGFADTYHAIRSKSPNDFMSSRSRLRTELGVKKDNSYLFASLNSVYNSILEDQTKLELREAFFQYTSENWDFKVGRQIVTWGVADGLRIMDIVSPMDYTEFLARDFDDIRIPVNTFVLKYIKPSYNLELVFTPITEHFILPVDDKNPWSFTNSLSMPTIFELGNKPDMTIKNSEFGGIFSFYLSGIDFSVSALHSWNKMPAFRYSFSENEDTLLMHAEYDRLDMLGMNFSMPVGKFVVRGEVAGYFGELQEVDMLEQTNNPVNKNTSNYLLGVDWYPGSEWTISAQYSQKTISNYEERLSSKKSTTLSTLSISKKVLRSTLNLSTFSYIDLTDKGFFNRTSADYSLSDQIHILAGYDWFHGDKGMFAYYKNNSEYWVKAKFSF